MISPPRVIDGLRRRVADADMRLKLELRRRRAGEELYVDYGWIRLIYTGDGDAQEVSYHRHQAEWHAADLAVFSRLVGPGHTVIDVGANLGFVTTILASLVGPDGRVLAFEPSPRTYEKLTKTMDANRLAQVTALNLGCAAEAGRASLGHPTSSSGNASILSHNNVGEESIELVRLDDVPQVWESPVRLLKIDTEGYEPAVLSGAERLISRNRPVIYIELGGEYLDSTGSSIAWLREMRYETCHVEEIDFSTVGNGANYAFWPSEMEAGRSS